MRIMATSDLHGNLEGLDPKGADVVVLAGDIAPLKGRGPWHINDQSLLCGHIHTGQQCDAGDIMEFQPDDATAKEADAK